MREGEQATAEVGILVNVVVVVIVVVVVKMTSVLVMLERIHCQVRFLHVVERQYMLRLCPCQVGLYLKCDCYKYHYCNCYHYPHPLCFCHDRPHCPADQDSGQCTCEYVEPGQRVCSSLIEVDNPGVDQVRQTFQFATRLESLLQIYSSFSFGFALFNSTVLFFVGVPVVPRSKPTNSSPEDRLSCCPALSSTSKHFRKLEGSS